MDTFSHFLRCGVCCESAGLPAHRKAEEALSSPLCLLRVFIDLRFLVTEGAVLVVTGSRAGSVTGSGLILSAASSMLMSMVANVTAML